MFSLFVLRVSFSSRFLFLAEREQRHLSLLRTAKLDVYFLLADWCPTDKPNTWSSRSIDYRNGTRVWTRNPWLNWIFNRNWPRSINGNTSCMPRSIDRRSTSKKSSTPCFDSTPPSWKTFMRDSEKNWPRIGNRRSSPNVIRSNGHNKWIGCFERFNRSNKSSTRSRNENWLKSSIDVEQNQVRVSHLGLVGDIFDLLENTAHWNYLREIPLDSTYGYMAANNSQIFLGWNNCIVIYDLDGMKVDETRLQSTETYGTLCDIVWSTTMQRFFILCAKSVFVHRSTTNRVEIVANLCLFNLENQYRSITTYQNYLMLLKEKSFNIWTLTPTGFILYHTVLLDSLVADPPMESICCIRANDQHLAVLIQNRQHQTWRLDLFDPIPTRCVRKGLPFDRFQELNLGLLTALRENTFLFTNWESKTMRRIDSNGSSQLMEFDAYNACLLGERSVLIVNYMKHLKIFQLWIS